VRTVARIRERKQAAAEFETAKREGKSASLLEESRPNVFSMKLANVLPGDTVVVELKYTELLVPTDGEYEFVYPTVVGPRYPSADAKDAGFVKTPYFHEAQPPPSTLRGSVSSNPAKISAGSLPTILTMTFRRPRWLIPSMISTAPAVAADVRISSSSGMSAVAPSREKRFVPG